MMTERERLLRRLAAYDFAIVEYNLYLDTHPHDTAVMHKFKESIEKSNALTEEFEEKYGLAFTLLADPERKVIEAYDVWKEKKNYGKVSMGVVRTTYLIDEAGTIIMANGKVKAADDPEKMLGEV